LCCAYKGQLGLAMLQVVGFPLNCVQVCEIDHHWPCPVSPVLLDCRLSWLLLATPTSINKPTCITWHRGHSWILPSSRICRLRATHAFQWSTSVRLNVCTWSMPVKKWGRAQTLLSQGFQGCSDQQVAQNIVVEPLPLFPLGILFTEVPRWPPP
jgi:hypothetical protein